MSRQDSWVASWCCDKLINHEDILSAKPISPNGVVLEVKDYPRTVAVATMSEERASLSRVPDEFTNPATEFLLNIPSEAYFDRGLIDRASEVPVGLGGIGDLYAAAGGKDFRNYLPKEVRFILRGLNQHSHVENVIRLNSRMYEVHRNYGPCITVLALNEYDLTADALRGGIEKYGKPDLVLASNPNCRASQMTDQAARASGTRVLKWGHLLALKLHKKGRFRPTI
jgi:hypothetical protein